MHDHDHAVRSFSLTERDRRWALVRSLMDSAGIEILVATDESNSRYLTQMASDIGPTILPIDGDVTALTDRGRVGSAAGAWIRDFRTWNRRWAAGIVERLNELHADRKIVGVTGLDGLMRHPDGDLNYSTFVTMREVFPHTRWVGASELMREARYVKSEEEIAFLERAARATDAGLLAAAACLRPGITDRAVWGELVRAMLQAGGDPSPVGRLAVASVQDGRELTREPVGRVASEGDMLVNEVDGRFAGYRAEGVQPVVLGPVLPDYAEAWKVHVDAWDRTWDLLRPGATFGDIQAAVHPAASRKVTVRQALRGRGLGDDLPLITSSASAASYMGDRVLREGVCFVLRPCAIWTGAHRETQLSWGDTVVTTRDGARRLGGRPREIIARD